MKIPIYTPPTLPNINLNILMTTPVLAIIFVLFLIIYIGITGVIIYHWSTYGMKSPGIILARTLYIVVSLSLFFTAFLGLTYY